MFIMRTASIASLVTLTVTLLSRASQVVPGAETGPVSATALQRRDSPFAVGNLFPDFAFPSLKDGTHTRLSDFRGKKVMLHVFASW